MANKINSKPQAPMTEQEISEKFNGGRRIIDFVGKRKIFFGISIGIIVLGIIFNFIFGTRLDIQFSGGATLTFSYSGDVDQNELYDFIQEKTTDKITTQFSQDLMGNTGNNVTVQFSGNNSIETDIQKNLESELQQKYPDNNFLQWALCSCSSVLLR